MASSPLCFIRVNLWLKPLRLHSRLLQQIVRRAGVRVFQHRQQYAPSRFRVSLGMVVIEIMTDVRGQRFKAVTW